MKLALVVALSCAAASPALALLPQCSQDFTCLAVYEPVCGTNGLTYNNDCELKKAQCDNKTLSKKSDGACAPNEQPVITTGPDAGTPTATTAKPSNGSTPATTAPSSTATPAPGSTTEAPSGSATTAPPTAGSGGADAGNSGGSSAGTSATPSVGSSAGTTKAPAATTPAPTKSAAAPLYTIGLSAAVSCVVAALL